MAKKGGLFILERTINNLCFGTRNGTGLLRSKVSLTALRWHKDLAFAGNRKSVLNLGRAAALASVFCRTLPASLKQATRFRQLTSLARQLFSAGFSEVQVEKLLHLAVTQFSRKFNAVQKTTTPQQKQPQRYKHASGWVTSLWLNLPQGKILLLHGSNMPSRNYPLERRSRNARLS